jgi:hypothetical protein
VVKGLSQATRDPTGKEIEMRRKNDAKSRREVEGVAQRLRSERPEASPLELDQIKTSAMSAAKATAGRRLGARRLAVLGLTAGLLAATTGGVIASQGSGPTVGNAAVAQYGEGCDVNNGGSNNGNNNGGNNGSNNGNNNGNCNENSFNTTNVTNVTNVTNSNYTTVNAASPGSGVLGSKTTKKAATSSRRIKIHVNVPRGLRARRVTVRLNGKHLKTITGKKASANVELVNLPCSKGLTTIEVTITLSNGKTVTARHQYRLCV